MKKILFLIIALLISFSVVACNVESKNKLEVIANNIFTEVDKANVTENLNLLNTIDGAEITYESSNVGVLANDGTITRGATDQVVYLTVKVSKGEESYETIVKLTIKAAGNKEDSNNPLAVLFNTFFANMNNFETDEDLTLSTTLGEATVSYSSSNTNVLSNSGVITQGEEDQSVTLTITITLGEDSYSKDVTIIVKALEEPVGDDFSTLVNALNNLKKFTVSGTVDAVCKEDSEESFDYEFAYDYDNNKTFWTDNDSFNAYLELDDEYCYTLVFDNYDGEFYGIYEGDDEFLVYLYYYLMFDDFSFDFSDFTTDDFTLNKDGSYSPKDAYLNDFGKLIIGDYDDVTESYECLEVIKSAKIYVNNKKISKITLETTYTETEDDDTITYDYSYVFNFSNIGNKNITIPDYSDYTEDTDTLSVNIKEFTVNVGTTDLSEQLSSLEVKLNNALLDITEYTIDTTEFDGTQEGTYTITITYDETDIEITVKVVDFSNIGSIITALASLNKFSMTGYESVAYRDYDDALTFHFEFDYDGSKIHWTDSYEYNYYFFEQVDGTYTIVYQNDDNTYVGIDSTDEDFYSYLSGFGYYDFLFDFSDFVDEDFELNNDGSFSPTSEALSIIGKLIIGDYDGEDEEGTYTDEIKSVKIYVENEKVTKIIIKTVYTEEYYDDDTYVSDCTYEFNFSNIGKVNITVPSYDEYQPSATTDLADIYDLEKGEEVNVIGVVTGIVNEKTILIADETGTATLYSKNTSSFANCVVGAYVEVSGSINIYKGLYEIYVTDISVDSTELYDVVATPIESLSKINYIDCQGMIISGTFTVKTAFQTINNDAKIDLTDGTKDVELFIKSSLVNSFEFLKDYKAGDTITLNNVGVQWYNGLQLAGLTTTNTELVDTLTCNIKNIIVPVGTTDITGELESLVVKFNGSVINSTQYTLDSSSFNGSVEGTYVITITYNELTVNINVKVKEITEGNLMEALNNLTKFNVSGSVEAICKEDSEESFDYEFSYDYDNDKIFWNDYDGYSYYIFEDGGSLYLVYDEELGGDFYICDEDSDEYYFYVYYYGGFDDFYFDFSDFSEEDFILNNDGSYSPLSNKLNEFGKVIIGDYDGEDEDGSYSETIKSLKIFIDGSEVTEINFTTTYIEDYGDEQFTFDYTYNLVFTNIGTQTVTIPEYTEGGSDDDDEEYDLADIYSLTEGTNVIVNGYITGIQYSKTVLIEDNTGTATLFTNDAKLFEELEVGAYVIVKGSITIYNGLYNIFVEEIEYDTEELAEITAEEIESISDVNDVTCQGLLINASLVVKEAYTVSGNDAKMVLTDGTDDVQLFIKGELLESFTELQSYEVGDTINLYNIGVKWYNGLQFAVLKNTTFDETQHDTLTSNIKSFTVTVGTTDISGELETLVIKYNGTPLAATDYTIDQTNFDGTTIGTYTITVSYNELSLNITIKVKADGTVIENADPTRLTDVVNDNDLTQGLPNTGDVNVLVLPIYFTGHTFPTNYKDTLDKAFNGTSEDTGWESLNSYYYKSSYGKLNLTATILDAYNVGTYNSKAKQDSGLDYQYILEVISYYDSTIDYSKYDSNNDGYIDCLYLIYSTPYNTTSDDSIWWAFTYEYYEEENEEEVKFDGKGLDYYMFFSYEFFNDSLEDGTEININCETVIHETGHALGLDDYYDYTSETSPYGGIGGGDMMDYNVGDHNAYSKAILGWINPTVVIDKSGEYTLGSFGATGDAIIIAKEWDDSLFTEYYIIDFYTCDGLNEAQKGQNGLFSTNGIRIYHVTATLDSSQNMTAAYDVTKYDNSDTKYQVISLVEADGKNDITKYGSASSNSDLFQVNGTISPKWNDKTSCGFTITVTSINSTEATITIDFK